MQGTQLDPRTSEIVDLVRRADEAVNAHAVDAFLALMTDDIVWETTTPPDGERFEGKAAVRAAGEGFFKSSPNARFETEEVVALGDRAFVRWNYHWIDEDGKAGHVRGVDVYRIRDGKIAEICSYVKG
jgi:uncharacterized protein (TIGR02246 family)